MTNYSNNNHNLANNNSNSYNNSFAKPVNIEELIKKQLELTNTLTINEELISNIEDDNEELLNKISINNEKYKSITELANNQKLLEKDYIKRKYKIETIHGYVKPYHFDDEETYDKYKNEYTKLTWKIKSNKQRADNYKNYNKTLMKSKDYRKYIKRRNEYLEKINTAKEELNILNIEIDDYKSKTNAFTNRQRGMPC